METEVNIDELSEADIQRLVDGASERHHAASPIATIRPERDEAAKDLQQPTLEGTKLSEAELLVYEQLAFSVPKANLGTPQTQTRGFGAIQFYRSFEPADAFEATVARLTVGCTKEAIRRLPTHNEQLSVSSCERLES